MVREIQIPIIHRTAHMLRAFSFFFRNAFFGGVFFGGTFFDCAAVLTSTCPTQAFVLPACLPRGFLLERRGLVLPSIHAWMK